MQTSKAIYRLSRLARLLDIEGSEEDVEALNNAVEFMNLKLKEEQIDVAVKHKALPLVGKRRSQYLGIAGKVKQCL
jgi:hypothetical protein